ncbi:FtsX-like permease family protein [Myceligenerans pegani]|uniref:ABC transporter permease n=1 Tax=Myceligenerans pegani TaxID=2776917 RepID=A0ABR9MX91_9MICO|nr:ABC transporter permease [Myceligenerans sp. TRM 65318]MBE1875544.1 ABC transporter permease [Myceligenerans sp. TRM 65318]MBE3017815.1 ABC transporter permease [Myceligenerans sp. TRM 65318]
MRTVLVASLRVHARRYVAAAVAVVVSVAFVVVVGVLTAAAQARITDGVGAPFRGADHVVVGLGTENAIAWAAGREDTVAVLGSATLPLRAGDERAAGKFVGSIATAPELRWQTLASGRFPERTGEAVVDVWTAQEMEIATGDRIRLGQGADAVELRVVGIVQASSNLGQAAVYLTFEQLLHWRDDDSLLLDRAAVIGDVGTLPDGATARTPEELVAESIAVHTNNTNTVSLMLLVFAAVAALVSVLVIANTFSILFAQRLRDFALLRCVGATRRQVVGSVRREAVVVGLLASVCGVPAGVGLGYGLIALLGAVAPRNPLGSAPEPPVGWMAGGFVVGVAVTVVASWLPTRRVVRVSPLAALRPGDVLDVRAGAGRVRLVLAVLLLVAGPALLGAAMVLDGTVLMLAGGGVLFAGVLLLGPVLVPRLVRVAGALLGAGGRLATENAVRNPRRTAATTASLLVGVTLTTAVLTGLATTRASVDANHGGAHPLDVAITSWQDPLPPGLVGEVAGTDGVARAVAVDGVPAGIEGQDRPILLLTAPDADQVARDGGAFAAVEPGLIALDTEVYGEDPAAGLGDVVTVRAGDRTARLRVTGGTGWGSAGVVAPETLAALTDAPREHAVWARAAAGVDAAALVGDLDTLADAAGATLDNGLQAEAADRQQLAVITWLVLGLLGISVVIALVGIANTLGLSVFERTREHAMLRALGLTRRQLRRLLAVEAMLLTVVAAVLGTVLGVAFAWAGYETFVKQALARAVLEIPWPQLGVVVLTAALAGQAAAILPARRAARVPPAGGLGPD